MTKELPAQTIDSEWKLGYTLSKLASLEPKYSQIVRWTPVAGITIPSLDYRDAKITEIPTGRVTLMDRGEGGMHAITDTLKFSQALVEVNLDTWTAEAAFAPYLDKMVARGMTVAAISTAALSDYRIS
ncbi:hypothetical protein AAE478_008555 [Parahypoxylon ruwenzoriense]